jgi:hypothetical protein
MTGMLNGLLMNTKIRKWSTLGESGQAILHKMLSLILYG